MNLKKIGKFIAEMRKAKGLTQEELAEKLGVNNRTISRWENGKNMPDISLYKPLCEILKISIEELVNGEKTDKGNVNYSIEKAIINTMNSSEKDKSRMSKIIKILSILILIIAIIVAVLIIYYEKKYPKIDIYNLDVIKSENNQLNEDLTLNMNDYKIWFYGIKTLQIGDAKNNYFDLKTVLKYNQVNMNDIIKYLDMQYKNENILMQVLRDGGTKIFKSKKYEVILCDTTEGNHDIYFGITNMEKNLNNNYCGKLVNDTCYYTRTYHIINIAETTDSNFVDVTLTTHNGNKKVVRINNAFDIKAGKNYEFVFSTYEKIEDDINNIFKKSTLVEVKETNHIINQEICVN